MGSISDGFGRWPEAKSPRTNTAKPPSIAFVDRKHADGDRRNARKRHLFDSAEQMVRHSEVLVNYDSFEQVVAKSATIGMSDFFLQEKQLLILATLAAEAAPGRRR